MRKELFRASDDVIQKHNDNGDDTAIWGHNAYSDLSAAEFAAMLGAVPPTIRRRAAEFEEETQSGARRLRKTRTPSRTKTRSRSVTRTPSPSAGPPAPLDWRSVGGVSFVAPVKDQGQCGSGWAFAAAAAIESMNAVNGGGLPLLSEQQLVDCSDFVGTDDYYGNPRVGNNGCSGGWVFTAFDHVIQTGGMCLGTSVQLGPRCL